MITPFAPDGHTLQTGASYELQSATPVPHIVTLHGTSKHKSATLTGQLTADRQPESGVPITIVRLNRKILPDGSISWNDTPAGHTRTNTSGHYTIKLPLQHTNGFIAFTSARLARCTAPAATGATCVNNTEASTQSQPITLSP